MWLHGLYYASYHEELILLYLDLWFQNNKISDTYESHHALQESAATDLGENMAQELLLVSDVCRFGLGEPRGPAESLARLVVGRFAAPGDVLAAVVDGIVGESVNVFMAVSSI